MALVAIAWGTVLVLCNCRRNTKLFIKRLETSQNESIRGLTRRPSACWAQDRHSQLPLQPLPQLWLESSAEYELS